jgi:penicillin-binding protein 1A
MDRDLRLSPDDGFVDRPGAAPRAGGYPHVSGPAAMPRTAAPLGANPAPRTQTPRRPARPGPAKPRPAPPVTPPHQAKHGGGGGGRPPGRGPGKRRGGGGGKPRRKAQGSLLWRATKFSAYWSFVLGIWGGIGLIGIFGYFALTMPPPSQLSIPERPANIRIVAMDGTVLGNRGKTGGEAVRLFELPSHLPQAVMAIEDRRFYSHFGVDLLGLARAMVVNVQAGRVVQGGSTLSQQLAKNLFLEPKRTIDRKIQEMMIALWLEWEFEKDEILEMYLNRVYLGEGATGVEAAAQRYYGKSARDIRLTEAATIAGLLKAPSRFAPTRNPERAEARMRVVLNAMIEAGFLTRDQMEIALTAPAEVRSNVRGSATNYVADFVMERVTEKVGEVRQDIIVDTTINPRLQTLSQDALTAVLLNEGPEKQASQGAIVSFDGSGAVRALVGGKSYSESQFNRATKAKRQPGSAFKPFVYAAAMEYGLNPDTLRLDKPVQYGDWTPKNYKDEFKGPVKLSQALSESINTVAVTLTDEVGPDNVITLAHRLGIDSALQRNLSIALGTSEVTLFEMTSAYVPFANGGFEVLPHVIERIRTVEGDILYQRQPRAVQPVLSPEVVGMMNYMMALTVDDGTARRAQLPFDRPAAGKTGTTQDFRDAWFVGYTGDLVTGVWIGNDDQTPMKRVTGGNLPAMVWQDYTSRAHEGFPIAALPGWYVPQPDTTVAMDQTLPWANDQSQPQGPRPSMGVGGENGAVIVQRQPERGGGFGRFLGRIFGMN